MFDIGRDAVGRDGAPDFEAVESDAVVRPDPSRLAERYHKVARADALLRGENLQRLAVMDHLLDIEAEGVHRFEGATDVIDWIAMRYRWTRFNARETVRVARALEDLPNIRSAFREARLSWDQLRAVTEGADADSDAELAHAAFGLTPAEIRRLLQEPADPEAEAAEHQERSLRFWFRDDRPGFRLELDLPDADGAILATALKRAARRRDLDPTTEGFLRDDRAMADAIVEMASRHLGDDSDPDRASILVTTDVQTLLSGDSTNPARIADGPVLSNDTLRRVACDARIQLAVTDPDVGVVGIGRAGRTVPQWMVRVIRSRDRGCRFPRCMRARWVHIHHIIHWADGGPTDLDNLITLCGFHHRMLHNDGWRISGDPQGEVSFIRPDGGEYLYRDDHIPGIEFHRLLRAETGPVDPPDRPVPIRF